MRNFIFILLMAMVIDASAQVVEQVDSIDLRTGVNYPANNVEVVDTVSCDTLDISNPPIPQIPFSELDSLTMSSLDARYVVVWKSGKCGIYDFWKEVNVTRIEYSALRYSFRKEFEGEFYTYYAWSEADRNGVVGVSEKTNEFVAISFPRENKEEEGKGRQ